MKKIFLAIPVIIFLLSLGISSAQVFPPDLAIDLTEYFYLTAGGSTNSTNNGGQLELVDGTNLDYYVVDFDQSTSETRQWVVETPDELDINANLVAQVRFVSSTATGGVCWNGSWSGVTNGTAVDVAFGTVVTGCDTFLDTAGDINTVVLTYTAAQHGLAASDVSIFKLSRNVGDASDTMTADARLVDVRVEYETTG